jgi:hypothetical protein
LIPVPELPETTGTNQQSGTRGPYVVFIGRLQPDFSDFSKKNGEKFRIRFLIYVAHSLRPIHCPPIA